MKIYQVMLSALTRAYTFLSARLALVLIGISCEAFYLFYFVRMFPLTRYYDRLTEIGILTNHSLNGFLTFSTILTVLFILFGLAWWRTTQSHQLQDRGTLWLILGFGALFALTMLFVYPFTAIDVYTYIANSLVLVQYHQNLMIVPPSNFSNDPLMRMAGGWIWLPAPYGPLGMLIDATPTFLVVRNLLANVLLLKGLFSCLILLEAFLVYKILSHLMPRIAISGALFVAWNPFMLIEYSANAHNDIMMMLFALLAVYALVKEKPALALFLITASALVKYATALLIPLFLIYGFVQQPTAKRRWRYLLVGGLSALALVIALYAPFWQGWQTISGTITQDQRYMSSFSTLLNFLFPQNVSLEQGKLLGRILYVPFYLFALFLSSRKRLTALLLGSFIALFFVQVLALSNFDIWYAIWSMMLASLLPPIAYRLAALLFVYGTSLSVTLYYYVWIWLGLQDPRNLSLMNAIAYVLTFVPALLILLEQTRRWLLVRRKKTLLDSMQTMRSGKHSLT
jgi:hypothetical protein